MADPRQHIHFCPSADGTRIAYAVSGHGPPLVVAPRLLTHLEYDWQSPLRRHWLLELSRERTLVRLDLRGAGLSDRNPPSFAFERWLEDLEAVVKAVGLDRFDLYGAANGGPVAVAYAARHPERVARLVLYGAYARGRLRRDAESLEEVPAIREIFRLGWGRDDPAFREVIAMRFLPDATPDQQHAFNELARMCTSGENVVRMIDQTLELDVQREAGAVRCPTLVMHPRNAALIPYQEGQILASLIPGAEFVTVESRNYLLLATEPAWAQYFAALRAFLAARDPRGAGEFAGLTARETEVLELLAHGLDNAQIAARLELSEKTVRNHVTALFDKLGVETRAQAIVRARDAGYARRAL